MRFPLSEKLIQRQINHWSHLREVLREQAPATAGEVGPVITISRLAGSGGRTLAAALADRLGLVVHDHSIVERIARTRKLSPDLVALLDEQDIRQSDLWVRGVLENRLFLKEQYYEALSETIRGTRQERVQAQLGISRAEARTLIDETDRRREAYVRKLFGVDPHEPTGYDLLVNTDRLSTEEVLEVVLVALAGAARRGAGQLATTA